jgi:hypothetical protein
MQQRLNRCGIWGVFRATEGMWYGITNSGRLVSHCVVLKGLLMIPEVTAELYYVFFILVRVLWAQLMYTGKITNGVPFVQAPLVIAWSATIKNYYAKQRCGGLLPLLDTYATF